MSSWESLPPDLVITIASLVGVFNLLTHLQFVDKSFAALSHSRAFWISAYAYEWQLDVAQLDNSLDWKDLAIDRIRYQALQVRPLRNLVGAELPPQVAQVLAAHYASQSNLNMTTALRLQELSESLAAAVRQIDWWCQAERNLGQWALRNAASPDHRHWPTVLRRLLSNSTYLIQMSSDHRYSRILIYDLKGIPLSLEVYQTVHRTLDVTFSWFLDDQFFVYSGSLNGLPNDNSESAWRQARCGPVVKAELLSQLKARLFHAHERDKIESSWLIIYLHGLCSIYSTNSSNYPSTDSRLHWVIHRLSQLESSATTLVTEGVDARRESRPWKAPPFRWPRLGRLYEPPKIGFLQTLTETGVNEIQSHLVGKSYEQVTLVDLDLLISHGLQHVLPPNGFLPPFIEYTIMRTQLDCCVYASMADWFDSIHFHPHYSTGGRELRSFWDRGVRFHANSNLQPLEWAKIDSRSISCQFQLIPFHSSQVLTIEFEFKRERQNCALHLTLDSIGTLSAYSGDLHDDKENYFKRRFAKFMDALFGPTMCKLIDPELTFVFLSMLGLVATEATRSEEDGSARERLMAELQYPISQAKQLIALEEVE